MVCFFLHLEDWKYFSNFLKKHSALLIAISDPMALSIIKSPGEAGADIYVGEGQSLGNPMNFGGPLLGIISIKERYKRMLPGRIVGKTEDIDGNDNWIYYTVDNDRFVPKNTADHRENIKNENNKL